MDAVDRLKVLIDTYKMSIRGFAIKCGIPQQTLDGQLKRKRAISFETITAIAVTFPDVSAEWLMRGVGPMLHSLVTNHEGERLSKLVDTIATLQDTINAKNDTIDTLLKRVKQLENQSTLK